MENVLAGQGIFWGKLRDEGTRFLPLEQRCLDVASVFRRLTTLRTIRGRLERAADSQLIPTQLDRLAVLALLHDFGKANLGFQDKPFDVKSPRAGHIREIAPLFNETDLSCKLANSLKFGQLANWFSTGETLQSYIFAILSHHGSPIAHEALQRNTAQNYYLAKTLWWCTENKRDPYQALAGLMRAAQKAFPNAFSADVPPLPETPAFQHRFAGLLMLADWLGSDDRFFPVDNGQSDRFTLSPRQADRAVRAVGLEPADWQTHVAGIDWRFDSLFGFSPRPLQATLNELSTSDPTTRLLIAEAETGSGKTEAALARFLRLFAAGEVDGLYFALPTRVAARELYRRVATCIDRLFPNPDRRPPVLLAVPGYAQLDGIPILPDRGQVSDDEPTQRLSERAWAAQHPKRFLAATIAVGTIDQALLSAIQTPHAHLRSVCLDRQLLVVDEVHASDSYMAYLLAELLRHHLQGGHALLLSATLGTQARSRFHEAAGNIAPCPDLAAAESIPYPALSNAEGRLSALETAAESRDKAVTIECLPHLERPETLLPIIIDALHQNARVLIVCNTVGQAIKWQQAAEACQDISNDALFRCLGIITPHHGRYAPADREQLDAAVSTRLGKGSADGPLLLIGTQTLEQSLDIDADLLITDLCPMDVLLQRIGRLHRHDRKRPAGFEKARCLLLVPDIEYLEHWLQDNGEATDGAKRLGLGSVYPDLRSLQRTWEALCNQPRISLPRDNRRLVELATHPESLGRLNGIRWERHAIMIEGSTIAVNVRAHQIVLARCYDKPFGTFSFCELDQNVRTRLGLDSLDLDLPEPITSPFGSEIRRIVIPGHLAPKTPDPMITALTPCEGGFAFRIADSHYRYTRLGLEREQADARPCA